MKNTILSLLVAVGLIGSASAATLTGDLANGLVAYYSFAGNANDSSGNGNNLIGASEGVIFGTNRFGEANSSISFSSITDSAQSLNPIGISGNSPRTFSLWVNDHGIPDNNGAVFSFGILNNSMDNNGALASFGLNNGQYANAVYLGGAIAVWGGYADSSAYNMSYIQNAWHMITYVYNGSISSSQFYVDGNSIDGDYHQSPIPSSTLNQTDVLNTISTKLTIGNFIYSSNGNTIGAMQNTSFSDLGIWNTALTSQQVSQLYAIQSVPEPSTYALLGLGAIGMLMVMRRKKTA